jgi:hypothetical protein
MIIHSFQILLQSGPLCLTLAERQRESISEYDVCLRLAHLERRGLEGLNIRMAIVKRSVTAD